MAVVVKRADRVLRKYWRLGLLGVVLVLLMIIPIRLAIASYQAPDPQAILVLGGRSDREAAAAQLAKRYPELKVWVSTGETPLKAREIFRAAGVADDRLYLDYRAVDTVTNFTTLVSDFKQRQIQHLYLVTSDFHMPRSTAIATVVLGSQGIAFTPVAVPSTTPPESSVRILRDVGRSVIWLLTGRTGSRFKEKSAFQSS